MKGQSAPSGNETIAISECMAASVINFDEEFIADIRPYCSGVSLQVLLIDMASWYAHGCLLTWCHGFGAYCSGFGRRCLRAVPIRLHSGFIR